MLLRGEMLQKKGVKTEKQYTFWRKHHLSAADARTLITLELKDNVSQRSQMLFLLGLALNFLSNYDRKPIFDEYYLKCSLLWDCKLSGIV